MDAADGHCLLVEHGDAWQEAAKHVERIVKDAVVMVVIAGDQEHMREIFRGGVGKTKNSFPLLDGVNIAALRFKARRVAKVACKKKNIALWQGPGEILFLQMQIAQIVTAHERGPASRLTKSSTPIFSEAEAKAKSRR